jgi:hypothetical protein
VLHYWLKGLKYRSASEKKRQTIQFSALIALLILLISSISIRAIAIGNEERAKIIESLEANTEMAPAQPTGIWLTGDSVILGIRNQLAQSHELGLINARVGRQAPELLKEILHDKANAPDGPVILDLGNNNALTEAEVKDILDALSFKEQVILVNTAVPRPWREPNNALIAQVAARYSNVRVIDWAAIFAPDGVHLVPTGVSIYVDAISKYLK